MTTKQQTNIEFNEVKPKTVNQHVLVKSILDNTVTICDGPAGSGKSILAIGIACKLLIHGKIDHILITRTIISAGSDLGAFTGNINEKCEPYFYAHYNYLQKILGKNYRNFLNNKIFIEPLEILRGRTYDRCVMILDEASNCDISQIKLFITRLGKESKAIIIGDTHQNDINGNGLRFSLNYLSKIEDCKTVYLTYDDIIRNEKLAKILEVFDRFGIIL